MAASVLSRWSTQVNKLTENKKEEKRGCGEDIKISIQWKEWPFVNDRIHIRNSLHYIKRTDGIDILVLTDAHATFDRWYFSCLPSERLPLVVIQSCNMSNAGVVRTKSKQLARAATQICCQIIPNSTSQSTIHPDGQASKRRGSSKWLSQEKAIKPTFFLETTTKRWSLNQFRLLPFDSSLQSQQKWRFK